jgi:serine/threonine protein kinase
MPMTPERWSQVEQLYRAAAEQPAAGREAWLKRACRGDMELLREVEFLLAQHPSAVVTQRRAADVVAGGLVPGAFVPIAPGRRLGPYEILTPIGAGAMGEVYRARDTGLGREVAIKILPPAFAADPDRLARFEREARILAALNHPNIATIHGVEEEGGVKGLVLELVEGETLAKRITRGPRTGLPFAEVLDVASQIAEALDAAHEKGIVHRDLKPANVMITAAGLVTLLDFGLARVAGVDVEADSHGPTVTADRTHAGIVMGTAAYMSPSRRVVRPSTSARTSGRSDACSMRC